MKDENKDLLSEISDQSTELNEREEEIIIKEVPNYLYYISICSYILFTILVHIYYPDISSNHILYTCVFLIFGFINENRNFLKTVLLYFTNQNHIELATLIMAFILPLGYIVLFDIVDMMLAMIVFNIMRAYTLLHELFYN